MANAEYDLDGDGILTVDWTIPAPSGTYDYSTAANIPGVSGFVKEEGVVNVYLGNDATAIVTLDLNELDIDPGETTDVSVTTILFERSSEGIHDQIQDTIEVTMPIDVGGISISCQGISPTNPDPGDVIDIPVDYTYSGDLSHPTVTFETILDGDTVSQIATEENTVGGEGTITLTPILDSGHQPGDDIDVTVEATDISPSGSF